MTPIHLHSLIAVKLAYKLILIDLEKIVRIIALSAAWMTIVVTTKAIIQRYPNVFAIVFRLSSLSRFTLITSLQFCLLI